MAFVVLTCGAAAMACLLSLLPAAGHDQMWCLYVAAQMRHGVMLYGPHLIESNPPLIMWSMVPVVTVARSLHLGATLVFKTAVVAVAAATAAVGWRLLCRLGLKPSRTRRWGLLFAFIAVFGVIPARDFGQRDHLLALLVLPYVLAAALREEQTASIPRLARVGIGIAAGFGICLKPHHVLIPVAIELVRSRWRARPAVPSVRPELLALVLTCLAYLGSVCLLSPLYLHTMIPILRDTYWAIGPLTIPQLARQAIQLHVLAAVVTILFIAGRKDRWQRPIALLVAAGAAATIAYYLQGTGWYYQQLPALSFFSLALCAEINCHLEQPGWSMPEWTPRVAGVVCAIAVALAAYFSGYSLARPLSFPSGLSNVPDAGFFAELPPGTPVAILTTAVDDAVPPVFTRGLVLGLRQNNLWTLPALLRNENPSSPADPRRRLAPDRLAELDRMQHKWMAEDLAYWRPALILVARCQDPAVRCQILEDRHDDLLAWFARDAAFREQFSRYRFARSSGPYDAYIPR